MHFQYINLYVVEYGNSLQNHIYVPILNVDKF